MKKGMAEEIKELQARGVVPPGGQLDVGVAMTVSAAVGLRPTALDPARTRDLTGDAVGPDGELLVLPAAYWEVTTWQERLLFGVRHGFYGFPTVELVELIKGVIAGRSAIEIGAGNGAFGRALGIPSTDSYQQTQPDVIAYYQLLGQPVVNYGPDVIKMDAYDAVRAYKPDVVIGQWITHRFDPVTQTGNEHGPDEFDILDHCQVYIHVGTSALHAAKPVMRRPHHIEKPSFVYSRAKGDSTDFVAVWKGNK